MPEAPTTVATTPAITSFATDALLAALASPAAVLAVDVMTAAVSAVR